MEDIEFKVAAGFTAAQKVTETAGFHEKLHYLKTALEILVPLSAVEYAYPRAAFGIGLLAHHMGHYMLNAEELDGEERIQHAANYFAQAGRYFEIAAAMPDVQKDFMPARAKSSLAQLHEDGVLGEKDMAKAFSLRQEAAQAGFAEAQINLAVMYKNGAGTPVSLPDAMKWIDAALQNKAQLPPDAVLYAAGIKVSVQMMADGLSLPKKTKRNGFRP